eukprot:g39917.t1
MDKVAELQQEHLAQQVAAVQVSEDPSLSLLPWAPSATLTYWLWLGILPVKWFSACRQIHFSSLGHVDLTPQPPDPSIPSGLLEDAWPVVPGWVPALVALPSTGGEYRPLMPVL